MMQKLLRILIVGSLLGFSASYAEDEDISPLGEEMNKVSRSVKQLRRVKDDYAKGSQIARTAQEDLLKCFAYVPAILEKMPEGKEREVAFASYKKMLADSYKTFCDLEIAYLSEDTEKIQAAIKAVKKSRKDGHEEYIEEEE